MAHRKDFDRELVAVLSRVCARARELSQNAELPHREVKRLRRVQGVLAVATETEIDWHSLESDLAETEGLWEELTEVRARAIENGELIPSDGPDPYPEFGAHGLWDSILRPIVRRYQEERPGWEWEEPLAWRLLDEWQHSMTSGGVGWCQTLAPLHNFEGPDEAVAIEEGLVIRPLTDADREALWLNFGNERAPNPLSPSIGDLAGWSHAIECKWRRPDGEPFLRHHTPGVEGVRDALNAIRLQHPGVTGTTIVWTRPDPSPELAGSTQQAMLSAPDVLGSFKHPLPARLEPEDADRLGELLRGLRAARGDRRLALALRRFDAAYSRAEEEDSLIDLWIAFEALLLPDERSRLSQRAARRIAELVTEGGKEREEAFRQARHSYKRRSEVVHGEERASDLETVVEQTRELARQVLRAWILD